MKEQERLRVENLDVCGVTTSSSSSSSAGPDQRAHTHTLSNETRRSRDSRIIRPKSCGVRASARRSCGRSATSRAAAAFSRSSASPTVDVCYHRRTAPHTVRTERRHETHASAAAAAAEPSQPATNDRPDQQRASAVPIYINRVCVCVTFAVFAYFLSRPIPGGFSGRSSQPRVCACVRACGCLV